MIWSRCKEQKGSVGRLAREHKIQRTKGIGRPKKRWNCKEYGTVKNS